MRKGKYPESDSAEAVKAGEKATTQIGKDGTNKGKIFRFNPGKEIELQSAVKSNWKLEFNFIKFL